MANKSIFKLSKDEKNKLEVLLWLLSQRYDDRGSGRTTILAMAFIITALDNPGRWIEVFDHQGTEHSKKLIMWQIEHICPPQLKDFLRRKRYAISFYG